MKRKLKPKTQNLKPNTAFTLIELLIVIGLTAILMTIGVLNLYGFRAQKDLDLTVQEIVSVLRSAQNRAISQESISPSSNEQWAVYFENPVSGQGFYALFRASSDSAGVIVSKSILRPNVQFDKPTAGNSKNVFFSSMSGRPVDDYSDSDEYVLKISLKNSPSNFRTINIDMNGSIQY